MNNYRSLCTEYYDLVSNRASDHEVKFYLECLRELPQPYLEAMCGSGRLLIPLVEKGLLIHGVDYSPTMLDSCRCRLGKRSDIELMEAAIETMDLPSQYGSIFIAAGSLQLIERSLLLTALQNLHRHLIPGGALILETWIPWQSLNSDKSHSQASREIQTPDGKLIKVSFETQIDRNEQLIFDKQYYVKYEGKKAVESDKEQLNLNWYYRFEMELLLEKAGFVDLEVNAPENPLVPESLVYRANTRAL